MMSKTAGIIKTGSCPCIGSPCRAHRISCYNPAPFQRRFSGGLFNFPCARSRIAYRFRPPLKSGGAMTFYDPTLYGRDEEEEFGDSGAYTESLEEDFEEEEEEEEEAGVAEPAMGEPVKPAPPPPPAPKPRPAAPSGGGGAPKKPAAKKKAPARKPAAKKKAPPKPAKKKAAKPAKKKAAKKAPKRPAKKAKKKAKKG